MAGLIDPNDIAKARQSGYSDNEISAFLSEKHPDQFKAAREAGYDDKEIIAHLSGAPAPKAPEAPPSGIAAGFAHGVAAVPGGLASTVGLTGAKTGTLDALAAAAEPKDYKAAPIVDKDWGFHPGNIPQSLAEAAPGIATDMGAGWAASKVAPGGLPGKALAGAAGFAGSALLRTFGHGAHENADARTGVPNSPVEGVDMGREGVKQAITAVPNYFLGGRMVPNASRALAESAMAKLGKNALVGGGAGAANDVVNQVGTTIGTKDGVKYDPTQTINAGATGALLSPAMAAPRAAADAAGNFKYRKIESDPEIKAAATALANRNVEAADGKKLVSATGGTKVAEDVKARVHSDIHEELSAAVKAEDGLSQSASNTLASIQKGGKASASDMKTLAAEASPETVSLARQALLSSELKAKGGLSGAMEKLRLFDPKYAVPALATALATSHVSMGVTPAIAAGVYGTYGAARAFDKMSGMRSPTKGFTERFADPEAPIRTPEAPPPVVDPNFDPTTLRQSLNTNAKLEEGISKITGKLGADKRKAMLAEAKPLLKQLAETRTEPEAPTPEAPWSPNPVAMKMTQARLKAGLPPVEEPAATPEPAPPPPVVISPIARKMLEQKLKAGLPPTPVEPAPAAPTPVEPEMPSFNPTALKMLQGRLKAGLPPEPTAQIAPTPAPAPEAPSFNPTALKMLQSKLKAGLPPEKAEVPGQSTLQPFTDYTDGTRALKARGPAPMTPAAAAAEPSTAPASEPIAVLMAKLSKKSGDETVTQTPHPEADQPYVPMPEKDLYRKFMTDDELVDHEFAKYEPAQRKVYGKTMIENREGHREDTLNATADHSVGDRALARSLFDRLDHIKDPVEAEKAVNHFTARMHPEAAAAIKERYTPAKYAKRWKKRKSK